MTAITSTVQTEYGEYVPLSQRLPKFQDKFPLEEGFGIDIVALDPLSLKPALLELYKECIRCGRSFKSMGLPPIPSHRSLVFVAKLVKDDRVLNSASTHQMIDYEKDYENAETRARQRLVAACGFPGNLLELDESGVATDPGRVIELEYSSGSDDVSEDLDQIPDSKDDGEDTQTTESPTVQPKASDIPAHVQQQVDALCVSLDAKGVEYSKPDSKKSALTFIREHRGGNGASP